MMANSYQSSKRKNNKNSYLIISIIKIIIKKQNRSIKYTKHMIYI